MFLRGILFLVSLILLTKATAQKSAPSQRVKSSSSEEQRAPAVPRPADHQQQNQLHPQHRNFGGFGQMTCRCQIIGNGPLRPALQQWAGQGCGIRQGYSSCNGHACYRADFRGVGGYGHGPHAHYSVLGCVDNFGDYYDWGSYERGSLEFTMRTNVSMASFFQGTEVRPPNMMARKVMELQCSFPRCQDLGDQPWSIHEFTSKMEEVDYHSSADRFVNNGLISMVTAVACVIFSQLM